MSQAARANGPGWQQQASFHLPYRMRARTMPGATRVHLKAQAGMVVRRGDEVPEAQPEAPQPEPRTLMGIELKNPVTHRLREFAFRNRLIAGQPEMVQQNDFPGKTLALCGAGPSLDPKQVRGVDHVWATNSALPWLIQQGADVDVGVGIDQTPGLLREWSDPPDVVYYLASTVDPALTEHLVAHGRHIVWFHNYVGWGEEADEFDHYKNDWPPAFMLGSGATVVPRMIALAAWQGFRRIDIHGADCALADGDIAHANGETAEQAFGKPILMGGNIDGRMWRTRPDLLMSAVDLVRCAEKNRSHIRLIGDTLPVALLGKPDAYLNDVIQRLQPGTIPTQGA